ncbi:DsbA family protein [Candidatus Pantoea deserta]|nr:thioredoxin domain-containing protein [Pantoea deserta]
MKKHNIALAIMLIAGVTASSTGFSAESQALSAVPTDSADSAASSVDSNSESSEKGVQAEPRQDKEAAAATGAPSASSVNADEKASAERPQTPSAPVNAATNRSSDADSPATTAPSASANAADKAASDAAQDSSTPAAAEKPAAKESTPGEQSKASLTEGDAAELFTPEQEQRIGVVAKQYLLAHPEVLVEVSEKLESMQHEQQIKKITAAVIQQQDALLSDKSVPSVGPSDAKVAVIEFFDYQCVICSRQAPVIQSLMQASPEVRYVFMEWPIFAARWKASLTAAETGVMIWQQKGADAYLNYHNALFATGHQEGQMTEADIKKAASAAGKLKGKPETMLNVLARTDTLAQSLGFMGTPGIIVMPVKEANSDNVTVFAGGVELSALQAAISKASGAEH